MERPTDALGTISPSCPDLIHELNQRYREQWDRAERLQTELNDIKCSRAWIIFRWLRSLRRLLLPFAHVKTRPEMMRSSQSLAVPSWSQARAVTSRVSILIPF